MYETGSKECTVRICGIPVLTLSGLYLLPPEDEAGARDLATDNNKYAFSSQNDAILSSTPFGLFLYKRTSV